MNLSRSGFITYVGLGTYSLQRNPLAGAGAEVPLRRPRANPFKIKPLAPSIEDDVLLPEGFDYQLLARGEALRMEQFRRGLPRRAPFVTVPNFDSDLHDLTGLTRMHRYLFETEGAAGVAAHLPEKMPPAASRSAETPTAPARTTPPRPRGARREALGPSAATRRRRPSGN